MLDAAIPSLSLLTTYRRRNKHLKVLLQRLARIRENEGFVDFELILIEGDDEPHAAGMIPICDWVLYRYLPMPGIFHKTVLLNEFLTLARGIYLMPFDVDLLPVRGVLAHHLFLARESPYCLIAGYRILLPKMLQIGDIPTAQQVFATLGFCEGGGLGPEDKETALLKYLLNGQRFGICPCFPRAVLQAVGGWHEGYVGWGAEDQDLIERVAATGLTVARAYDLLYLHLPHSREANWTDPALTAANRSRFVARRQTWLEEF